MMNMIYKSIKKSKERKNNKSNFSTEEIELQCPKCKTPMEFYYNDFNELQFYCPNCDKENK